MKQVGKSKRLGVGLWRKTEKPVMRAVEQQVSAEHVAMRHLSKDGCWMLVNDDWSDVSHGSGSHFAVRIRGDYGKEIGIR